MLRPVTRTITSKHLPLSWRHRGAYLVHGINPDGEKVTLWETWASHVGYQSWAKIINGDDYRHVVPRLSENGLAFDSELLFTLKRGGADWLEIPVNWTEKKGGKVKPLRDVWGMLAALIRVSRRVW